jgi:predicted permease
VASKGIGRCEGIVLPELITAIWLRIKTLFRRRQLDRDLDDELQFHLAMREQKLAESGASAEEARYAAQREFGNATQAKETNRDLWTFPFLETLWQDVRYGLRQLRRNPGFTAVAVITLALGIGANTAIFTLVDAVMLRNLPVKNPNELVLFADNAGEGVSMSAPTPGTPIKVPSGQWKLFSFPLYRDLRDHNRLFQGICAFENPYDSLTVRWENRGRRSPAQVALGKLVSGNFFSVLGVHAALGRTLTPEDDQQGAPPVGVVSYRYWQNKLGADPSAVGRAVNIDGVPMTLVGVMPSGFFGVRMNTNTEDFWIPLSLRPRVPLTAMPQAKSVLTSPSVYWLNMVGRLKPGVSLRQANAAVNLHFHNYLTAFVGSKMTASVRREIDHAYVSLAPGARGVSQLSYSYSKPLYILLAVVALVLLIACANLSNLLLSRSAGRQNEIAMRLALGATRGRLIRQMLAESVLLAVAGGIGGVLLASWGVRVLVSLVAAKSPLNVRPDLAVFEFTAGVSLLTVVLAGLAPALRSARVELVPALKGSSMGQHRMSLGVGKNLVVFQIAVSLLLLIGAGLLVRSLANLENQTLGFNPKHILLVYTVPELAGYKLKQLPGLYRELVDRITGLPGVRSASIGMTSPMGSNQGGAGITVEGQLQEHEVRFVPVGPQYFKTEGMRIVAGRGFSLQDTPTSAPVAVVNQAFARRFLPKLNPIGRRFSFGTPFKAPGIEIVGVVANVKYASLGERADPMLFLSAYQNEFMLAFVYEIEVRTAGNPTAVSAEVQKAIHGIDPNLPVTWVLTLTDQISNSLAQQQAISELTSFFGLLGLMLACVGLYGIMAYNVARRTNEIGIRMALGAHRGDVLWMVLRQTLVLIVIGIAIAVPVALAASRLIASQLYGLKPTDPLTISAAAMVIGAVGLLAGYLPALRASHVDPMVALRYE